MGSRAIGGTLQAIVLLGGCCVLLSCSAKYATNADGLPVGSPDVTYYGPGAPIGGTQIEGPPPPSETLPPPANLTTPAS